MWATATSLQGRTCVGFSPDSLSLAVLASGSLEVLTFAAGAWSPPRVVSPAARTVLAARYAPNSKSIAVSLAAVAVPAPALAWTLVDEVIIDVITKVSPVLCRLALLCA